MHRCPKQEENFLKPNGIYEVECSACGEEVEFFADDEKKRCPKCGVVLDNPRQQTAD